MWLKRMFSENDFSYRKTLRSFDKSAFFSFPGKISHCRAFGIFEERLYLYNSYLMSYNCKICSLIYF